MSTLIFAIILVVLFFALPIATVLGALGLWIGGVVGAVIGAAIGLFLQAGADL